MDDDEWSLDWLKTDFLSNKYKRKKLRLELPDIDKYSKKSITKKIHDDLVNTVAGSAVSSAAQWGSAFAKSEVDTDTTFGTDVKIAGKLTVDGEDIGATLTALKDRFLILEDDFEKHEQYPALKDAYEKYKLIEKLLMDNAKNDK